MRCRPARALTKVPETVVMVAWADQASTTRASSMYTRAAPARKAARAEGPVTSRASSPLYRADQFPAPSPGAGGSAAPATPVASLVGLSTLLAARPAQAG